MGLNITSTNNSISLTRSGSGQKSSTAIQGQLNINQPASTTDSTDTSPSATALSAQKLAERQATVAISEGASAINTKEYLSSAQLTTVQNLLSKAQAIKRETDPTKVADLAADASTTLSTAISDYNTAVQQDSSLSQSQTIYAQVDPNATADTSEGSVTTVVSAVSSYSSLGLSTSTSFSKANIDSTIATLEAAQSSLYNNLTNFSSALTDLSSAVTEQGISASQIDSAHQSESIDQLAEKLAGAIKTSTDSLLANRNVENLDIQSLLTQDLTSSSTDDSSSSDSSSLSSLLTSSS